MTSTDPFNLERFVEAQARNYSDAIAELRAGHKDTHWSWYVFPQLRGLGTSPLSVKFAIANLAEAQAYLEHPVLGPHLVECVGAMLAYPGAKPETILGDIDARKFHSCCTLFAQVAAPGSVFHQALTCHFGGRPDARTLSLLGQASAQ